MLATEPIIQLLALYNAYIYGLMGPIPSITPLPRYSRQYSVKSRVRVGLITRLRPLGAF